MTLQLKRTWTLPIIVASFLILLSAIFAQLGYGQVSAQVNLKPKVEQETCNYLEGGQVDCLKTDGSQDVDGTLNTIITSIINWLSIIVGGIAVIFIIVGGIRYATSGGNEEKIKNAKNTILYAVIGLIIVLFARLILQIVVGLVDDLVGDADATDNTGDAAGGGTDGIQ